MRNLIIFQQMTAFKTQDRFSGTPGKCLSSSSEVRYESLRNWNKFDSSIDSSYFILFRVLIVYSLTRIF